MHVVDTQIKTFEFVCQFSVRRSPGLAGCALTTSSERGTAIYYTYIQYSSIHIAQAHILLSDTEQRYGRDTACGQTKIKYGRERSNHHRYSICQPSNLFTIFLLLLLLGPEYRTYVNISHTGMYYNLTDGCVVYVYSYARNATRSKNVNYLKIRIKIYYMAAHGAAFECDRL